MAESLAVDDYCLVMLSWAVYMELPSLKLTNSHQPRKEKDIGSVLRNRDI